MWLVEGNSEIWVLAPDRLEAARLLEGERERERKWGWVGGRVGGRIGRTRGVLLELPWLLSAYRQHEATATLSHMQPLVHTAWFCRDDQNKSTTLLGQSLCVRIYWGMYQVCASIKNKTLFFTVILKAVSNVGGISFLICIQKEVKWPVSSAPKICSILEWSHWDDKQHW